jgi:myosin heavy subunit
MIKLEELNTGAILHNLRMRYEKDIIYTYISSILISVNPFKVLNIYTPKVMDEYRTKMAQRVECDPHVYALADNTYRQLVSDHQPQAVIISGESGAGKTEATKLVLQYLAEMSGQGSVVEQQLLQANPIIEAFGNAKTVRNNNSSRFGKWIEILFDEKYHIGGARIFNYLLEKSRIVQQGPDERNYHVFYQFCAGASPEERNMYDLRPADQYRYLSGGNCFVVDGMSDAEWWVTTRRALEVLKFKPEDLDNLFRVISGVLHLGNVGFQADGASGSRIENIDSFQSACRMLSVEPAELEKALVTRTIKVMNENITSPLEPQKASDGRDALAKALYGSLFDYIIAFINQTLFVELPKFYVVGVLDIFGFEIFETNRFEQFCINFANEKLQQHFNTHIFTMEQNEYKAEQINVEHVDFIDNQECLDLIESKPHGILAMCDEEIRFPKGSDQNLLDRMDKTHDGRKYYVKRKVGKPVFTIDHYAGQVTYQIEGFLEKNKDALEEGLASVIKKSRNRLASALLMARDAEDDEKTPAVMAAAAAAGGGAAAKKATAPLVRQNTTRAAAAKERSTLGSKFKEQLQLLLTTLHACSPQFIRCIKPNASKCSDNFDSQMVTRQLQYLGVQEVVKIRQLGYPVRAQHENFWQRYRVLRPKDMDVAALGGEKNVKALCGALLRGLNFAEKDWRVGLTKVFVRQQVYTTLEREREKMLTKLWIRVQSQCRKHLWEQRYKRSKQVKDHLVKLLTTTQDHEELEAAVEAYESLNFALDDELISRARSRAKVLYEMAQARRALQVALESKDEALLRTALETAKRVRLDAREDVFVKAERFYEDLRAYKAAAKAALEARDLAGLEATLRRSQELGLAQDSSEVLACKALRDRVVKENACRKQLADAIAARDLTQLQKAITFASELGLPADEAQALEAQIQREQRAIRELKGALEAKHVEEELVVEYIAAALKVGISEKHELVIKGHAMVADIRAAKKAAEEAKKAAEEAKKAAEKAAAEKRERIANAKNAVLAAIASKDMDQVESALKRAQVVSDSLKGDAEVTAELSKPTAEANALLAGLKRKAQCRANLRAAVLARKLQQLAAALEEAKREDVEASEEAKSASSLLGRIEAAKSALEAAMASNEEEALAKALGSARDELSRASEEGQLLARAEDQLSALVKEREAKAALQAALRARAGSLIQTAMNKAKEAATETGASSEEMKELVQEAKAVNEDLAQEEVAREQEVVEAYRRASTVPAKGAGGARPGAKRRSIIELAQVIPESKASTTLEAELKQCVDKQFEIHLFPGLRAPSEFAEGKLFGKKALKTGMLFFTKEIIPTTLTKIVPDVQTPEEREYLRQMVQIGIQVFKSVQGFMGDRHYSFQDGLANQVLNIGLKAPLLRDEIYVQTMKQLKRNPTRDSQLRGWQLLALTCETFPPSDDLLLYMLHFVKAHIDGKADDKEAAAAGFAIDSETKEYAQYCISALRRTIERPPREAAPDIDYITQFRERTMASGKVMVFFLDGSAVQVQVDPLTKVRDLVTKVAQAINLSTAEGFGLYEIAKGTKSYLHMESHVLEHETGKLDVRGEPKLAGQDPATGAMLVEPSATRFIFKKRMFLGGKMAEVLQKDHVATLLMFHQAVDEVTRGNFCLPLQTYVDLAALYEVMVESKSIQPVSQEFMDKNQSVRLQITLRPPASLFTSGKVQQKKYEKALQKAKESLKSPQPADYLAIVSQFPMYGCQFFTVTQENHEDLPKTMVVGVNMTGAFLMNWNSNEMICHFPIQGIAGWKGTAANFVIRVQMELVKWFDKDAAAKAPQKGLQTLYLNTNQGKHIADLIRAYVDALVAHMKSLGQRADQLAAPKT